MSAIDGTVRLSVEIPIATNEKLKVLLPWGTKSEVFRVLIDKLLEAQVEHGEYIMADIIKGRCKISVEKTK